MQVVLLSDLTFSFEVTGKRISFHCAMLIAHSDDTDDAENNTNDNMHAGHREEYTEAHTDTYTGVQTQKYIHTHTHTLHTDTLTNISICKKV